MNNLNSSSVARQNILNNKYALSVLQQQLNPRALSFDGEVVFTKEMISDYFEVDTRTIERYVSDYRSELSANGYRTISGRDLIRFKNENIDSFGTDISVGAKTTILSIFNFRAFLDIGMLLSDSEVAKELRSAILDIVIDVINQRAGGKTKYINQRDSEFLVSWLRENDFRKEFTDALDLYVDMGPIKYGIFTNKIYADIFSEKANEYRQILKLSKNERIRDTMYAEVLTLIASYESGLAYELKIAFKEKGRKLTQSETRQVFEKYHAHPRNLPLLYDVRSKMASRDLAFRDALHQKLEDYIHPLSDDEYEKFIGEKSVSIEEQLEAAKDVFVRLKEY